MSELWLETREYVHRIPFEDLGFVPGSQPGNALDVGADVIVPFARARIGLRTGTGTLCAEETAIGADDAKQQLQRLDIVKRGVEIKLFQSLVEVFRIIGTAQLRAPAPCEIISFSFGKSWNTFESTSDKIAMLSSVIKCP